MSDPSFLTYVSQAGFVVKLVMLVLLLASVVSWAIIFQRVCLLHRLKRVFKGFEATFWSGVELNKLYEQLEERKTALMGIQQVFCDGFKTFLNAQKTAHLTDSQRLARVTSTMQVAQRRSLEPVEHYLSLLASIGSTGPYIGLFGTVWGIMTSFHALGQAQQATISMVAPGISEALIATAMGLLAAIPAVLAYNLFVNQLETMQQRYQNFQEEFINVLRSENHTHG